MYMYNECFVEILIAFSFCQYMKHWRLEISFFLFTFLIVGYWSAQFDDPLTIFLYFIFLERKKEKVNWLICEFRKLHV